MEQPRPAKPTDDPAAAGAGLRGPRGLAVMVATAVALVALDLWSKDYAFEQIGAYPARVVVVNRLFGAVSFDLINSMNQGAAFGIMKGAFGFFGIVSILALGLLGYFSWTASRSGPAYHATLGAVASGVLGNLHDRLRFQGVRDFLDVYIAADTGLGRWLIERLGTSHWPTFNVADAAIVVGTILLVLKFYKDEKHEARHQEIHDHNRPFTKRPDQR